MMDERREYIGDDWLDEQSPERQRAVIEDHAMAETLQKYYVCAGCWGHLTRYHVPDNRLERVVCDKCGDGRGFVTKRYADNRRGESAGEKIEVTQLLQAIGVMIKPQRSAEQVLADLGF